MELIFAYNQDVWDWSGARKQKGNFVPFKPLPQISVHLDEIFRKVHREKPSTSTVLEDFLTRVILVSIWSRCRAMCGTVHTASRRGYTCRAELQESPFVYNFIFLTVDRGANLTAGDPTLVDCQSAILQDSLWCRRNSFFFDGNGVKKKKKKVNHLSRHEGVITVPSPKTSLCACVCVTVKGS